MDCGVGGPLLAADRQSCSTLLLKLVSGCAVKSPDGPVFYAFWLSKEDSDATKSTDFLPPGVTAVLL